jgi:hypothetical protein
VHIRLSSAARNITMRATSGGWADRQALTLFDLLFARRRQPELDRNWS